MRFCVLLMIGILLPIVGFSQSIPNQQTSEVYIEFSEPRPLGETNKSINKQLGYSNLISWKLNSELTDELNQTHRRYTMYFDGIEVFSSRLIVHSTKKGVFRINGRVVSEADLNVAEAIMEEQEGLDLVLQKLPSNQYYWQLEEQNLHLKTITGDSTATFYPKGELTYIGSNFRIDTTQLLTWHFNIYSEQPLFGKSIYINAVTGELVAEQDLILHAGVTGTAETAYSGKREIQTDSTAPNAYRLRDYSRGKGVFTLDMNTGTNYNSAVDFTDTDNYWDNVNAQEDEVATDAHWGAEMTYDYFKSIHGRNSFDNQGAAIYSFVHYSQNYDNAFWNGYYMTYGDGNKFKPLTALDVCGHEIAHAVTTNTANLVYKNESGALNESFSDIFGQSVEAWSRPNQWEWKMGEDITTSGNGLRDMSNPNPYNNPKYYKGNKWYFGTGDNGGVHYNSGVQNYWFYLLVDGVKGTNEKGVSFDIDSLGYEKAAKIAYRNLSVYLTSSSTYTDARKYSIIAAEDLYGTCSKEVQAVTEAWFICGVGTAYDSSYVNADFAADTLACSLGDTLHFKNLSSNYNSCRWYFGDGDSSDLANPSHVYSSYAKYDIQLKVESCDGKVQSDKILTEYVKVDSSYDICSASLLPNTGSDTTYRCHGFIYDDGGEGNYGALKTVSLTLDVPNADSIWYKVIYIDYENGFDSLVMFHSDTSQKNKIAKFTGTSSPILGKWQKIEASKLVFVQYSDPLVEGRGFKMEYQSYRPKFEVKLPQDSVSLCFGDSFELKPTYYNVVEKDAVYSYPLSIDSTPVMVKPKSDITYIFGITDQCIMTNHFDTIHVLVRDPLNVSLNGDTTICMGQLLNLVANANGGDTMNYTYNWANGLSDTSKHTLSFFDTTLIQVVLDDACSIPDTASMVVNVRDSLKMKLVSSDSLVCPGGKASLKAETTGGLSSKYQYSWLPSKPSFDTMSLFVTDTTWVHVELTDGCTVYNLSDSFRVDVPSPLKLSGIADTTLCESQTLITKLNANGGDSTNYHILWNSFKLKDFNDTVTFTPGDYFLQAVLSDGCMPNNDTISFQLHQRDTLRLSADIDRTKFCLGDSFRFIYQVNGGDSLNYDIRWQSNPLSKAMGDFYVIPDSTLNIELLVSDGCSPDKSFRSKVIVSPSRINLTVQNIDSLLCWDQTTGRIEIDYDKRNEPVSINWLPSSMSGTLLTNLDSGNYLVSITDTFGCVESKSFNIKKRNRVLFTSSDTLIDRGDSCYLWVSGSDIQSWSGPNILGDPYQKWIYSLPLKDTFYIIEAQDINGCELLDTIFVQVVTPADYKIQNVITPNADGKNDFWNLTPLGELEKYKVMIFNRVGEIVFQTDSYTNDWNGKTNDGAELDNGVYFYRIIHGDTKRIWKGYIQLIK